MTLQQHNEIRAIAARAKNWYHTADGRWVRLTLTEARRGFGRGELERRATVDEELDLDGI